MLKKRRAKHPDAPQCHPDHPRPVTRRQLIAQGFMTGGAAVMGGGVMSLFSNPLAAQVQLSGDLETLKQACGIATQGAGKVPFIAFDLAGGANIAGSNVLIGQQGGQLDFLSTNGYSRQGLPGDMIPSAIDPVTQLPLHGHEPGACFPQR